MCIFCHRGKESLQVAEVPVCPREVYARMDVDQKVLSWLDEAMVMHPVSLLNQSSTAMMQRRDQWISEGKQLVGCENVLLSLLEYRVTQSVLIGLSAVGGGPVSMH